MRLRPSENHGRPVGRIPTEPAECPAESRAEPSPDVFCCEHCKSRISARQPFESWLRPAFCKSGCWGWFSWILNELCHYFWPWILKCCISSTTRIRCEQQVPSANVGVAPSAFSAPKPFQDRPSSAAAGPGEQFNAASFATALGFGSAGPAQGDKEVHSAS